MPHNLVALCDAVECSLLLPVLSAQGTVWDLFIYSRPLPKGERSWPEVGSVLEVSEWLNAGVEVGR